MVNINEKVSREVFSIVFQLLYALFLTGMCIHPEFAGGKSLIFVASQVKLAAAKARLLSAKMKNNVFYWKRFRK